MSDFKLEPEALTLSATPPRIVRFKRSLLIAIAAVACAGVFGLAWVALQVPGFHARRGADELLNIVSRPSADGLANLPSNYGQMQKPQLGPPLPSDLGPPIAAGEKQRVDPIAGPNSEDEAARAERMRLAQQSQQAREGGLFFEQSQRGGSATAAQYPAGTPASAAATPTNEGGVDSARLNLDLIRDQNDQQRKVDFVAQAPERGIYNDYKLERPISPYQVMAGTVIAASLLTGLNSDLPGTVTAQVTENIFDSATGRIVLIPQGSRLIGTYDSVVAFGQSRALLVWQRIIMPDGSSIRIDNLPASDTAGYTGLADEVDYHTWTLLKGIAMSTLLGVGTQATFGSSSSNLVEAIRQSTQESTNQAGQRIVEKDIEIQPTLTVRPGFPLRVIVHKDLILRPYQG